MRQSRRRFLTAGLVAVSAGGAGATWWASSSNTRTARWLRRIAVDTRRPVTPVKWVPNPSTWSDNHITVSWLGHATVLINFYGLRILTDPALHDRVGVSLGFGTAGPKRYIAPALRPPELPPVDLLLISHAHMDHLDLPSLKLLPNVTPVVTAPLTSDLLVSAGLKHLREVRWNGTARVNTPKGDITITGVEVKHWGQRWPGEFERGYNGYILEREGKRVLFGGDTAWTERFRDLRSRGSFELAIMPIGAYRPWIRNHCTPEEAVKMGNDAGARFILPMHHQTFKLSDEPMEEPIERLTAALSGEPERVALRDIGETFVVPA